MSGGSKRAEDRIRPVLTSAQIDGRSYQEPQIREAAAESNAFPEGTTLKGWGVFNPDKIQGL